MPNVSIGWHHFDGLVGHQITFNNSSEKHDRIVAFANGSPGGIPDKFTVEQGGTALFDVSFDARGHYRFPYTVVNSVDNGDDGNGGITVDMNCPAVNQSYNVDVSP